MIELAAQIVAGFVTAVFVATPLAVAFEVGRRLERRRIARQAEDELIRRVNDRGVAEIERWLRSQ